MSSSDVMVIALFSDSKHAALIIADNMQLKFYFHATCWTFAVNSLRIYGYADPHCLDLFALLFWKLIDITFYDFGPKENKSIISVF